MHKTVDFFVKIFYCIIQSILHELNWSNIFVTKDIMFITFLHVDQKKNKNFEIVHFDIDIFLYEFNVEQTNVKLNYIQNVWKRNRSNLSFDIIIKKSFEIVEFFANYSCCRLQIILKLKSKFIDVLLKFDLNICAIEFDDNEFFMLLRCARTLKSEYNIFNMNLIWNYHLTSRRKSRIEKIFKYVNREFDLRILLSYARFLTKQSKAQKSSFSEKLHFDLKLLKRIAWSEKIFVYSIIRDDDNLRTFEKSYEFLSVQRYNELRRYNAYFRQKTNVRNICSSIVTLWNLACENYDKNTQSTRNSKLCNFEIFTRFCEA